jgi:hypothetical protein
MLRKATKPVRTYDCKKRQQPALRIAVPKYIDVKRYSIRIDFTGSIRAVFMLW